MGTSNQYSNKIYSSSDTTSELADYDYHNLPDTGSTGGNHSSSKKPGFIDYYITKFDQLARGRVPNKYHVSFYGPYVEQALLIMSRNSYGDKYSLQPKLFADEKEQSLHYMFQAWADMFYVPQSSCLNMYWAASNVTIPSPTAESENVAIDSVKGMTYPLIKGIKCDNSLTITVVDDPYMMWFQFFNALFNTQFTPLVLKATSTFKKINVQVNEYIEMTTQTGSRTDLCLGEMFEFNDCILDAAPEVSLGFGDDSKAATYSIKFSYPNAFQGSFKDRMRYMIDNSTCDDKSALSSSTSTAGQIWTQYGDYNKGEFEEAPMDGAEPNTKASRADIYAPFQTSTAGQNLNLTPILKDIAREEYAITTVGWNKSTWHRIHSPNSP